MKKILNKIIYATAAAMPLSVLAINPTAGIPDALTAGGSITAKAPAAIADTLFDWFLALAGVAAVAGVVYGGILYAVSGGDETKVTKAKQVVLYGIIAGIVIILAYGLVSFLTGILTGGKEIGVPTFN